MMITITRIGDPDPVGTSTIGTTCDETVPVERDKMQRVWETLLELDGDDPEVLDRVRSWLAGKYRNRSLKKDAEAWTELANYS